MKYIPALLIEPELLTQSLNLLLRRILPKHDGCEVARG
jgi:hypothetical protein